MSARREKYYVDPADHLRDVSVDVVIVGYEEGHLKCLLLRVRDRWMLQGGFVGISESTDAAAQRVLVERTGLIEPYLKFLTVFGKEDRNFDKDWHKLIEANYTDTEFISWMKLRRVTLGYYSLVNIVETHPQLTSIDDEIAWFSFDELPVMWMDHREIAMAARTHLKNSIRQNLETYNLLTSPFTMPELHRLHQVILGEEIDRSRFQKKMLSTGLFKRLPKRQKESPGRNPYQYEVIDPICTSCDENSVDKTCE